VVGLVVGGEGKGRKCGSVTLTVPAWVGKKPEKKPPEEAGRQALEKSPATTLWFHGQ